MNRTITRAQLIQATENTLDYASGAMPAPHSWLGPVVVPPELAEAVRDVARTADRICGNWASADGTCGCLIGTLRMRRGFMAYRGDSVESTLGILFCDGLDDVLDGNWDIREIFDVVDEEAS